MRTNKVWGKIQRIAKDTCMFSRSNMCIFWSVQFIIYCFVKVISAFILHGAHSCLTNSAICFIFKSMCTFAFGYFLFVVCLIFFSGRLQQHIHICRYVRACCVIIIFIWCLSERGRYRLRGRESEWANEKNTKWYLLSSRCRYLCHCINWHQQIEQQHSSRRRWHRDFNISLQFGVANLNILNEYEHCMCVRY